MYRQETNGIRIEVSPFFIPEKSNPEEGFYVFAYQVRITNIGETHARLVSRHWIITDGNSRREEILGKGVVGEQPSLAPGQVFEYTSSCPLPTPTGNMRGWYHMVSAEGDRFKAKIPVFFLRSLDQIH